MAVQTSETPAFTTPASEAGAADGATNGAPTGAAQIPAFDWRSVLALAVGGVLLAVIVAGSVLLSVRNAELGADVVRTQRVRAELFQIFSGVQDAETGQRGFLLTGRDVYLEPYTEAVAALPARLERLAQDMDYAPEAAIQLNAAVRAKLEELAYTLRLSEAHDFVNALSNVQTDRGKLAMDEMRRQTDALLAAEQARLSSLVARLNGNSRAVVLLDSLSMAAVIGLAALVVLGVRRGIAVLGKARSALRDANARLAATNAALASTNERLEERVAARTAALTAANEEVQRFAYIVSHDLRAPLVNIMGFTSELEEALRVLGGWIAEQPAVPAAVTMAANDDLPEAIRFIRTSTGKMDRLIGAILKLSREGKRNLANERLDMAALVGGVADSLRHQAEARGTTLAIGALPDLVADRIAVEQAFANVVENALKYLSPGRPGHVTITGRREGDQVVYEVADNGRGIAERDRDRVFELFRRAGDQTVPGEGIGLAHVRALLRRMGGDVDFTSELGAGTTFRIVLPRQPAQHPAGHLEAA